MTAEQVQVVAEPKVDQSRPSSINIRGKLPSDKRRQSVRFSHHLDIQLLDTVLPEEIPLPESQRSSTARLSLAELSTHDETDENRQELESSEAALVEELDSPPSSHSTSGEDDNVPSSATTRSRSASTDTISSQSSGQVDWNELQKSEEQNPRDMESDDATAFLLARLEQENDALATNPKAKLARARSTRKNTKNRPASIQFLRRLVADPNASTLQYTQDPEPPTMTELDFWAALVNNYFETARRLPSLTSKKIRGGVPAPLRGLVWQSIAGANDVELEEEFERLAGETSSWESLISKDVGRSFPGVDMFRDSDGEGQQMLAQVLKCFSLYDEEIGYCQGLGFVVGPLLMHMGDKEAFCVLIRLMEHYDLRSCFLPDLSGLHLRIYQFQQLLRKSHPKLTEHLAEIGVEPLYISQWFLSFFAITCPLPMLLRIYDVILTEGASETLMRVALSLMRRNESKLLACDELEDAMSLLLGRPLWDTYACNADDLVNDSVGLTGLVTRESLEALESAFKSGAATEAVAQSPSVPNIQAAAGRLLGRFWTSSNAAAATDLTKITSPTASLSAGSISRPASSLHRSASKQSLTSTLNSTESSESRNSTSTDATALSKTLITDPKASTNTLSDQDRDFHTQIEDLLTALGNLQREQGLLATQLQKEREEREEDRVVVQEYMKQASVVTVSPNQGDMESERSPSAGDGEGSKPWVLLAARFNACATEKRSSLAAQTKQQMREETKLWKAQYEVEAGRTADLTLSLAAERDAKLQAEEDMHDTKRLLQEAQDDKQRLESVIAELKVRRYSTESDFETLREVEMEPEPMSSLDFELSPQQTPPAKEPPELMVELSLTPPPVTPPPSLRRPSPSSTRRLETPSPATSTSTPFAPRGSSLGMSKVLATQNHRPPSEEAMLVELVSAKTAEASARQELEEVKSKLESLRRMIAGGPNNASADSGHSRSASALPSSSSMQILNFASSKFLGPPSPRLSAETGSSDAGAGSGTGASGFFSGWGRRAVSNPPVAVAVSSQS